VAPLRTINDAFFEYFDTDGIRRTVRRGETADIPEGADLTRGDKCIHVGEVVAHHLRQPVCFALDEMYGAPLRDLPELLSEGGGQGLLIVGALQDLNQAEARWGRVGRGFLTYWQNTVVLPGIKDQATLELLSLLIGDFDRVMPSQGQNQVLAPAPFGFQRRVWMHSEGESIHRQRKLPPDAIYQGNPNNKREVLVFTPNGGWQHMDLMRYWSFTPWPYILSQSSEWALKDGRPQNYALPLPELDLDDNLKYLYDAGGQPLVDSWISVKRLWRQKQSEIPRQSPKALPRSPRQFTDIQLPDEPPKAIAAPTVDSDDDDPYIPRRAAPRDDD
jgi:hypothetical protein